MDAPQYACAADDIFIVAALREIVNGLAAGIRQSGARVRFYQKHLACRIVARCADDI